MWFEVRIYQRADPKPVETWRYRTAEAAARCESARLAEWRKEPKYGPIRSEVVPIDPPIQGA